LALLVALGAALGLRPGLLAAASGDLDSTFSPDANGAVLALAVQSDGKVLIGGDFTTVNGVTRNRIARLNADGTLDSSFDPNADGSVQAVVVRPDGVIFIGGSFTTVSGASRKSIAMLNADGTLGANTSTDQGVNVLALQADGKVVLGGVFDMVNGAGGYNMIARLNADGTVDALYSPFLFDRRPEALALQADGKMLVAAFDSRSGGDLMRLNINGSRDSSFRPKLGKVLALAVQPDGKILIGGDFTTIDSRIPGEDPTEQLRIARLNADGSRDTSFNPGADASVRAIVVQADGSIIIGGDFTSVNGVTRNRIARLNADGTLDSSFAPNANGIVSALALQADGKVVLGGTFTTVNGVPRSRVARLLAGDAPPPPPPPAGRTVYLPLVMR